MTRMLSSFRALLGAGVCLLPLQAFAQSDTGFEVEEKPAETAAAPAPTNWITIGGQYNSSRSYYLGRYNGVVDPGFSALGGLFFSDRDAWDSGGTSYLQFQGENLGRSDRSFSAKVGEQGKWGLSFTYDGIPYYATNSFKSIWSMQNGVGVPQSIVNLGWGTQVLPTPSPLNSIYGTHPTIQNAWQPVRTNGVPNLLNYNLSTQRDIFTLGGKYQWGDWLITSGWRHEHKDGWQANSVEIGGAPSLVTSSVAKPTSAITTGMAYFAQPIDYDTDRFDITGAYSTEKLQAQLGYTYSQFQDNLASLDLLNPFGFTPTSTSTFGGSSALAGAANAGANYVLPPSNAAHQFKTMLGYNLAPNTRLNVNLGYGLQMQDATFIPGSGNTNPGAATANLVRPNYDGLIQTVFGNIALVTQPLPRLDVRVSYTIDDRDNQSPRNGYSNIAENSTFSTNEPTYYNMPFSIHHQTGVIEAGYRLAPQTKLTLTETLDDLRRNYSDTRDVLTNRIAAKLRGPVIDEVFGSLSYAHEQRWASDYNPYGWWDVACGGPTTCSNTELKSLMMYSEASRTHDEVKGMVDISPIEALSVSIIAKGAKDNYPTNASGLRSNYNFTVGPDVSWQASKAISAHTFYTYQQIYYNQSSYYSSGTLGAGTSSYTVPYNNQTTDSVQTFGVDVDWQAIPELLKISMDGNFAYGDTAYALGDGMAVFGGAVVSSTSVANLTMKPLPDVKSTLITIGIHGEYNFRPNMSLLAGYSWQKFNYKDFMVGTSATQYANALLPGTLAPNDSIHTVFAAVRVKF